MPRRLRDAALAILVLAALRVAWTTAAYFANGRYARYRVEAAWIVFAAIAIVVALWRRAPAAGPPPDPPRPGLAWLAGLMALAGALYWQTLSIGLLSDDYVLVAAAGGVSPSGWPFFRPLPIAVWTVVFPLGGPAALHALNVALHGFNGWLLARLLLHLGHTRLVAATTAAFFVAFPAVEAVAWNSAIFDIALVAFGLLFLHAAARGQTAAAIAWLVAALLSKEPAVALPFVAAALGSRLGVPRRLLGVSIVVAGVYGLLRLYSGIPVPPPNSAPYRYVVKEFLVRPFATLAVPWTGPELAAHPVLLGTLPVLILLAAIALRASRSADGARLLTGPAMVLLSALPLGPIFFVDEHLEASRYVYMPLVGWCVFLADLAAPPASGRRRPLGAAIVLTAVVAGSWGVTRHLTAWQRAAALRDQALERARDALARSGCTSARFEAPPDTVDGAFVFRNGLPEALRQELGIETTAAGGCRFRWNGADFARVEAPQPASPPR